MLEIYSNGVKGFHRKQEPIILLPPLCFAKSLTLKYIKLVVLAQLAFILLVSFSKGHSKRLVITLRLQMQQTNMGDQFLEDLQNSLSRLDHMCRFIRERCPIKVY
jgi:hypothetical protein